MMKVRNAEQSLSVKTALNHSAIICRTKPCSSDKWNSKILLRTFCWWFVKNPVSCTIREKLCVKFIKTLNSLQLQNSWLHMPIRSMYVLKRRTKRWRAELHPAVVWQKKHRLRWHWIWTEQERLTFPLASVSLTICFPALQDMDFWSDCQSYRRPGGRQPPHDRGYRNRAGTDHCKSTRR